MAYLLVRESGCERYYPAGETEIGIGRSRRNAVRLATERSSRQHCLLKPTAAGKWEIVDAGSSNGTFVNELRVHVKELEDGDVIRIGEATITFREGSMPVPEPAAAESATVPIPLHDRNVQILFQTILAASTATDLDRFLEAAVDGVVEISRAERGVLFVADANGLEVRMARDQERRPIAEVEGISRSIPRQVYDTDTAVYLLDSAQAEEVSSRSVSIYQLRTVMCAPLRVGDQRLGVLYVDSKAKTREFSAADLAIFEAVANTLALTIENVRAKQQRERREAERRLRLEAENALLRGALEKRRHLVGESPAMKDVYETVRKAAPTDANVLIVGESGTGKEAIAHALHDLSPRASGPFVVIDGAAIPEMLLESELFGYEKGAFTGATGSKPGKFELAQGGTLFLDEIAELSPALQAKLLRALEQKVVTRVGGVEPIRLDVRLVAATNRDLAAFVAKGRFRQDLYFRLKVVTIALPPLRDRGDDIELLADFFIVEANAANGRSVRGFSPEARAALRAHRWDGNVRELKHRIEQAVILTDRERLAPEDLNLPGAPGAFRPLEAARDQFEKAYILRALERHGRNVTHTAGALGISRQHLQNLLRKYGIARYNKF
ncbi:MAG: sigma 54-interacting transcriptional regulator [Planctomycetes bacterium]|nr:sigma 54-interacting transcriptional regulator [Planctomycetota bacterium]